MSDVEAVGELPGGGAFTALWQQVDGNASTVSALMANLSSAATDSAAHARTVKAAAARSRAGWTGAAADALDGYLPGSPPPKRRHATG